MPSGQQTGFNIDEAKVYLAQLQKMSDVLKANWSGVHHQWSNLKTCWRDRQYQKFSPIYEKLNAAHSTHLKSIERHILVLKEQIQIAEERANELRTLN